MMQIVKTRHDAKAMHREVGVTWSEEPRHAWYDHMAIEAERGKVGVNVVEEVLERGVKFLRADRKVFRNADDVNAVAIFSFFGAGLGFRHKSVWMPVRSPVMIEIIAQANLLPWQRVLNAKQQAVSVIT